MTLKSIAVALLVFSCVITASAQSGGHFWIPTDVKWTRIPGAPREEKKRTTSTVVLYFGRDQSFVRDECWLIRDGKSISISNGDPHNEYVGRITEQMADGARIEYRLVRRTVDRAGEVLPGPKIVGSVSVKAKPGLAVDRRFFRRINFANERDYIETYNTLSQQYQQN